MLRALRAMNWNEKLSCALSPKGVLQSLTQLKLQLNILSVLEEATCEKLRIKVLSCVLRKRRCQNHKPKPELVILKSHRLLLSDGLNLDRFLMMPNALLMQHQSFLIEAHSAEVEQGSALTLPRSSLNQNLNWGSDRWGFIPEQGYLLSLKVHLSACA